MKTNGLFLILGAIELDCQYLINDEFGIGIDLLLVFADEILDVKYYVFSYYHLYFSKKYASGFFVEAFGMLNSVNDYAYDNTYDPATDIYY